MLVRKLAEMEEKLTQRQARATVKEEPETILSENSARACIFPIKYEKVWKMVSTVFRPAIPAPYLRRSPSSGHGCCDLHGRSVLCQLSNPFIRCHSYLPVSLSATRLSTPPFSLRLYLLLPLRP